MEQGIMHFFPSSMPDEKRGVCGPNLSGATPTCARPSAFSPLSLLLGNCQNQCIHMAGGWLSCLLSLHFMTSPNSFFNLSSDWLKISQL